MAEIERFHPEVVVNIIIKLRDQGEWKLAYSFLYAWDGELELSEPDLIRIFECVVAAGGVSEAKALIELGGSWTNSLDCGWLRDQT